MAVMKVNPTRMELTRLKKRLKVAVRGHKLLKDKRDEMVRQFMELIRQNKVLREQVEQSIAAAQREFLKASLTMSPQQLEEAFLSPADQIELKTYKKNIMSVVVPGIDFSVLPNDMEFYPYGLMETAGELDKTIDSLKEALPKMIQLAELEKTCNMLADEIEKTRRRVNALEYVMIPQIQETIKYITMKLDENERGNLTRLMKMKEMLGMN